MTVKRILDELNELLEKKGIGERVNFTEPVTQDKIEEAERELGVTLPPSYVEFVTQHGLFYIDGGLTGRGSGNDTELFSPEEIIEKTLEYRKEMKDSNDIDSQKILDDGLIFCADPCDEYFYLFVLSSAGKNKNGEMYTRGYDYQDPACCDPWYEVEDGSFESVVEEVVNCVKKNLK